MAETTVTLTLRDLSSILVNIEPALGYLRAEKEKKPDNSQVSYAVSSLFAIENEIGLKIIEELKQLFNKDTDFLYKIISILNGNKNLETFGNKLMEIYFDYKKGVGISIEKALEFLKMYASVVKELEEIDQLL